MLLRFANPSPSSSGIAQVAVTHCGAAVRAATSSENGSSMHSHGPVEEKLYAELLVDLPLAFGLGIVLQHFTIAPVIRPIGCCCAKV